MDWLFPRRCPVCDRPTPGGERICPDCAEGLSYIQEPRCCKCGKHLTEEVEYCFDCGQKSHLYVQGAAVYEYNSISHSLYRFKYKERTEYADFYGEDMARVLGDQVRSWEAQALIPVPLHKKKLRLRGYNQAEELAIALGKNLDLPCLSNAIYRQKITAPMKELDPLQRQINLKNAFIMGQIDVKLKRVIVVDDIYTTGSTVDAIAKVLLENGLEAVYYVALAIGTGM